MKKHWKEIFFILPSIAVAAAAVLGFQMNIPEFAPIAYPDKNVVWAADESHAFASENEDGEDKKEEDTQNDNSGEEPEKISYTGDGTWKDGVYTGLGTGFGGIIEVSVTIKDGKITDIQIVSSPGETLSYLEQAKAMIPQMLAAQSPNVDTVSGATYSSNGIKAAVIQALNKAGGSIPEQPQPQAVADNSEEKKSVKKKKKSVEKGQPADGVYTGSAVCEQFGYTLSLKVRFRDKKTTSIYGLKITDNEDEANEAYWKKAWKPMVKRILKAQDAQVDAVSGATYSSNAIVEAYQNARKEAIDAGKNKKSNKKSKTKKESGSSSTQPAPLLPDDTPQAQGAARDGVYTVSALCEPDERQAFSAYTLTADVAFKDGKCVSIGNFTSTDDTNRTYYIKAAEGTAKAAGVVTQIIANQSASGISAVSGATCSSKTIRKLYLMALSEATGVVQEEAPEEQAPETPPSVLPESPDSGEGGEDSEDILPMPVKDGTYTVSAMVEADEWEEFDDYSLTADVTFYEGKLTEITNLVLGDPSNQGYCNQAANGYGTKTGIIYQLIRKPEGDVDVVTGATCSSLALIQIYKNALEMAME